LLRTIIASILTDIEALNFTDRVAGIVTPVSKKIIADEGTVLKTFPAYENTPTQCEGGDYFLCVPDEKFKSVVYFEEISNTVISETSLEVKMEGLVRLVGWFNRKKINVTDTTDTMLRLIFQTIPQYINNFGEMYDIRISFGGFENKSPSIFSGYTYDEAETQYLIFPFDYGSMLFNVNYTINRCVTDITVADNCGQK